MRASKAVGGAGPFLGMAEGRKINRSLSVIGGRLGKRKTLGQG